MKLSGKNIKLEWTKYIPDQDILDKTADEFVRMVGWIEYADYILTYYQDIGFPNSFDDNKLQNESKKIKLYLRLQNTPNIDSKDGSINLEIQNIIQHYADGIILVKLNDYDTNNKTKNIFNNAKIFNGLEQIYSIIFVPLIWKTLQLCGYIVPTEWIKYKKLDTQSEFTNLAIRLSKINGFAEFALFCILDYFDYNDYLDIKKYDSELPESKYILQQNNIVRILDNVDNNTNLTIRQQIKYLFNTSEFSMMGGHQKLSLNYLKNNLNNYKQKYQKYKQKYMKLTKIYEINKNI